MPGPEARFERQVKREAKSAGWRAWKFVSPGIRGVPDDFFFRPGRTVFIEFKDLGETPTPQQLKRMEELNECGIEAYWCDTLAEARRILNIGAHS